jgi:hypothetical protein
MSRNRPNDTCPVCGQHYTINKDEKPEDRIQRLKEVWEKANFEYMQESSRKVIEALGISAQEVGDRLIAQNDMSKKISREDFI